MAGWLRLSYIHRSAPAGTPPFVAGLWLLAPVNVEPESVTGILSLYRDAWNNHIGPATSSDLTAGVAHAAYEDDEVAFEDETPLNNPSGGSGYRGPGISVRAIFTSPRPPGGRPNQCYFPWPPAAEVGANGAVSASVRNAVAAWGDAFLEDVEVSEFQWRARHFLGTENASSTQVTGVTAAATASWLNRRYR